MKISTTNLILLCVALIGLYFAVDFFGGKDRSKSLRSELVKIDTASVSSIEVKSSENSVSLAKENGQWLLTLASGQKVVADKNAVKRSLEALLGIKPSRLATRNQDKWEEYQVADTMGTRVQTYEGGDKTLDIILGKLGVTGQRSYHTFVRLAEDDEVYVANDFMSFNIPSDGASYRNQSLARIKKDSVASIDFTYPGDSSFRLVRRETQWLANGQIADSASVAKYLQGIGFINSKKFIDDGIDQSQKIYAAQFNLNNGSSINLDGYVYNGELVFNSSENDSAYFADSTILTKAFRGPSQFE
jgi:hypothetical protein